MQKGIKKLRDQQLMNKGLVPRATQKKEPWREVAGKLSTWQKWISLLGKNDKGKDSRKLSLKRWEPETLKEEKPNVSSLRHTRTERQQVTFEEETPKEENYEK